MKRRFLAMLLSLAMVLTMLPVSAFAAVSLEGQSLTVVATSEDSDSKTVKVTTLQPTQGSTAVSGDVYYSFLDKIPDKVPTSISVGDNGYTQSTADDLKNKGVARETQPYIAVATLAAGTSVDTSPVNVEAWGIALIDEPAAISGTITVSDDDRKITGISVGSDTYKYKVFATGETVDVITTKTTDTELEGWTALTTDTTLPKTAEGTLVIVKIEESAVSAIATAEVSAAACTELTVTVSKDGKVEVKEGAEGTALDTSGFSFYKVATDKQNWSTSQNWNAATKASDVVAYFEAKNELTLSTADDETKDVLTSALAGEMVVAIRTTGSGDTATLDAIGMSAAVTYNPPAAPSDPTELTVTVDAKTNAVTVTKPGASQGADPETVNHTNLLFFTATTPNSWKTNNWKTDTTIADVQKALTPELTLVEGKLPDTQTAEVYLIAVEKATVEEAVNLAGIGETTDKVKYTEPELTIGEVTVNATTNVITPNLTAGSDEEIKYALADKAFTGPVTAKTVWDSEVLSSTEGNKVVTYSPTNSQIDSTATGKYLIAAVVKSTENTVVSIACTKNTVTFYDSSKGHVTVSKQSDTDNNITIDTEVVEVAGTETDKGTATIKVTATAGYQPVVVKVGDTTVDDSNAEDYQFTKGSNNEYTLELSGLSISENTAVVIKSEATTPTGDTLTVLTVTVDTATNTVTVTKPGTNAGDSPVPVDSTNLLFFTADATNSWASKNWNTDTDISTVQTEWTSNALAVTNGKLPESMTTEAYVIAVEKASDKLAGIGETAAKVKYNEPALTIGQVTVDGTTNVITHSLSATTGESIKYALAEAKYTGPVTAKTVWATGVVSTENKITEYTPETDNKIGSTATGNYLIAAVVKDEGGTVVSIACTSAPVSYYDASKAHVTVTKQDPNDDKITIETTSVEVAGETADQGTATIKVTATEGYQPVVVSIGGTAVSAADYQFTKGSNNEYTLELTGLSISADTAVVIKSEATTPTVETFNVTVTTEDDNVTIVAPAADEDGEHVASVETNATTEITVDVTEGYTPAITGMTFTKGDQTGVTSGKVRWTVTTPAITASTSYEVTTTKDETGDTVTGNPNVENGTATGEAGTDEIEDVLNNATDSTDEIVLDFSTPAGTTTPDKVEKAEIAIPTEAVDSINDYNEAAKQDSNKKEVGLSVKTPIGTVTVGSDVVEEMTKDSTFTDNNGQTVTPDATTMEAKVVLNVEKVAVPGETAPDPDEKQAFEIHFEKKLVRKGSDTVLATAPVEVKNTTVTITVATTVKPKTGTTTLIAAFVDGVKKTVVDWAAAYKDGNATFTTPHLSTFVLMAERDSDTPSGILIYDKDGNAVDLDDYSASGNALTIEAGGKLVLPSTITATITNADKVNVKQDANGAWILDDTTKDGTLKFTFEGKTYTATLKAATTTTPTTLTLTREGTIGYGIIKVKISGMTDGKVYLVESAATANNVTVNSYNVITGDSTGEAVIAISRGNVVTVTEHGSELDIANGVPPTATSNAFPAQ